MYSYEDRIRAVELYIKLGNRVRATIRQLGYPTKNALKGWHREYEQRRDLPVGYAARIPKYSRAQKEAAVEHYLAHDRCITATIRGRSPGGCVRCPHSRARQAHAFRHTDGCARPAAHHGAQQSWPRHAFRRCRWPSNA